MDLIHLLLYIAPLFPVPVIIMIIITGPDEIILTDEEKAVLQRNLFSAFCSVSGGH